MDMEFFERIRMEVRAQNTTIEAVTKKAGLGLDSYNGLRRRGIYPRADQAVEMARVLGVTVEYLVTGRVPTSVPERLRAIVESLAAIEDDRDLEPIRTLAEAARVKARGLAVEGYLTADYTPEDKRKREAK